MLIDRNPRAQIMRLCLLAGLLLCVSWARTQDAVYLLKALDENSLPREASAERAATQSFEFHRNLIFFPALMDGKQGTFILDTGAPTLLVNSRNEPLVPSDATGLGTGGEVRLAHRKVQSLEFGGQHLGKRWALALDLRSMEARTGRSIDGFIGYDLLLRQELRIDYAAREFSLLKSSREPLHAERAPDVVFNLEFVDHLPVLRLKVGNRKLRFILDTGAASNLLDRRYSPLADLTGGQINIQGLDGHNADHDLVRLDEISGLELDQEQRSFVSMDLSHLQSSGDPQLAGVLGSSFLERYVVGIDYRRQKLYLWYPRVNKQIDTK